MSTFEKDAKGYVRVVHREDVEAANEYLRRKSEFDFDAFLKDAKADSLGNEPLGPTRECLTADQISRIAIPPRLMDQPIAWGLGRLLSGLRVDRLLARLDLDALPMSRWSLRHHLAHCLQCYDNLVIYQDLTRRSERRLRQAEEGLSPVRLLTTPVTVVGNECQLRLISEPRQGLAAEQIDSESVVVSGAVFARGCQINEIEAPESHEGSRLFVARCEMQSSHLPTGDWDVYCDWVEARGRTVSGQQFSTRTLLCFRPLQHSDLSGSRSMQQVLTQGR